ncbi:glycosyltransferase family 39 protein [Streptantibioticus silvisoli]|uniref:Glycosyltransferase family 39 protein n=1 Tax=Streptantibioticus silvisoli TaxID=2705255 RepID=A0ABT6VVC2_9ACTN|nr:glycosyltransferase family 39 protein [Streptantibioticus silvisoli]MDI5962426.1 glycosyltransferase family 39 protein [Streptantibioticus silvisoli]
MRWAGPAASGLVASVFGLWRLTGAGMWRDEAVTYYVAQRSVSQLWRLTGHVDAVHGCYYLLIHLVFVVFGPSVPALRLPSVLAGAGTAALIAAVGGRLATRRAGLFAGVFWAVLPQISRYLQEGRSYALVSLCTVAGAYFLVRRRWAAFALALALACALNLLAVLGLAAFGVTILLRRLQCDADRPATVRAVSALMAAALAGAVPVALRSRGERAAMISWIPRPTPRTCVHLVTMMSGSRRVVLPVLLVAAVGCLSLLARPAREGVRGDRADRHRERDGRDHRGRERQLVALALPLAVLPPSLLVGYSLIAAPAFMPRYVLYAFAGAALLTGLGLDTLVRVTGVLLERAAGRRPGRIGSAGADGGRAGARGGPHRVARWKGGFPGLVAGCAAIAVVAASGWHAQLTIRRADGHGDPLLRMARVVQDNAKPGDGVLFLPAESRYAELAYPGCFRRTTDLVPGATPAQAAGLVVDDYPPAELAARLSGHRRVWVVRSYSASDDEPDSYALLRADGYHRTRSWAVWTTRVVQLWVE